MKTTLMIKDLSVNEELDRQIMSTVRGGRPYDGISRHARVRDINIEADYNTALASGENMMEFHLWYMSN